LINSQNMTSVCDDATAADITPEQVKAARRAVAAAAYKEHGDTPEMRAEIRDVIAMLGIAPGDGVTESILTPVVAR
jgi:hypothetical protein